MQATQAQRDSEPVRQPWRAALAKRLAGEPLRPADSVRPFTHAVHLPVCPWSPRSQGFPREADERPVPSYVEEELRGYLECGLLCFGFARAICMTCRTGFVVAFSCKGRGVCPSCNGRHMARDGRPPRRSRHPAGARAAVGDLRAEPAAGHACRLGITECLRRITSCEKPSRRSPSATSASGATPLPAGMGASVTPREAAATRLKSPARTTPPGLLGRNS
jgi:hypothetical protein